MKITIENSKLERYQNVVEDVARVFFEKTGFDFYFSAILNNLEVSLSSTKDCLNGLYNRKGTNFLIRLAIPHNIITEKVQFAFAHELSHLAFDNFSELDDYCETDNSYAFTHIIRQIGSYKYGTAIEEGTANFIALNVVSVMNNLTYEESKKFMPDISKKSIEITEKIINMFSIKPISPSDAFNQTIQYDEKYITRNNNFISEAVCGGNMSSVITEYDEFMGKESWKRLMRWYDEYEKTDSTDVLQCIEAEIDLFYKRDLFS